MRTIVKIVQRYDLLILFAVSIAVAVFVVAQLPGSGNGGLAAAVEQSLRH